jgi:hypothetical protein
MPGLPFLLELLLLSNPPNALTGLSKNPIDLKQITLLCQLFELFLCTFPYIHHNFFDCTVRSLKADVILVVARKLDGAFGLCEAMDVVAVVLRDVDADILGG